MKAVTTLPIGAIRDVLHRAGIELEGPGPKHPICCPFHEDAHASAFVSSDRNIFYCSVCTPEGGWSTKRLAEALGVEFRAAVPGGDGQRQRRPPARAAPRVPPAPPAPAFGPSEAVTVWRVFEDCARDDTRLGEDAPAYDYLRSRGLLDAWEERAFGIVPDDPALPGSTYGWRRRGYAIAAPLYDERGELCNVQARAIGKTSIKTLAPRGSKLSGLVFTNARGLEVLRRGSASGLAVLLGEGLTDALAFAAAASVPAFCTPGAAVAERALGAWVAGARVILAYDVDRAGRDATARSARRLFELGGHDVRRLTWPRGCNDACDVVARAGVAGLAQFLDSLPLEDHDG